MRKIAVEDIAFQMAVIGTKDSMVSENDLMLGLCKRFNVDTYEAIDAIQRAINAEFVFRIGAFISNKKKEDINYN